MKRFASQVLIFLVISSFFIFCPKILAEVDEHIVLWLRFDEGIGDVAKDSSNYGNNGQIVGPKWDKGKYDSALLFDGINDYVQIESKDSLQLSKEGLTLAAWFKTEEKTRNDLMIIEKGPWDPGEYALSYPGYANYRVRFQIYEIYGKKTSQIDSKSGVPELSDNNWHYAAGTYDAVNHIFRVYVDGVLEEEQGANPHVFTPDNQPVYIGTRNNQSLYFNGVIDEVLVANIPFTADQLNRHKEGRLMDVHFTGKLATVWGGLKK